MDYNFDHLKDTVEAGIFTPWQEVNAEIIAYTALGINVAINNEYIGLVYKNQVYNEYQRGEKLKAYIQCVRQDGKIDISLQPNQSNHVFSTTDKILEHLKSAGGKSSFNDKSSPEDIKHAFQISKMVFKRTLGKLYKQGKIKMTPQGIELLE